MGGRGGRSWPAGVIRSYAIERSRQATLELLRALGVRDRPLPPRFRRASNHDPTIYMHVHAEGIVLWQHPLSGRRAQVLPLRFRAEDRGIRVEVLRPRLRAGTRRALGGCAVLGPVLVWMAGPLPLIPLLGGVLCGLWLHFRGYRAVGLERMVDDNFEPIERSQSRSRPLAPPIVSADLLSAPISSPISAPVPAEDSRALRGAAIPVVRSQPVEDSATAAAMR
jgi:hypothetical protein